MAVNSNQQEMINKLFEAIECEGIFLKQNENKSAIDKMEQLDILLDVQKFLINYEEATKVLNDYLIEHRWEIKSKQDAKHKNTDTKDKEI